MSYFERLTPVPDDVRFGAHRRFNEEQYTMELGICESNLTTRNIGETSTIEVALSHVAYARASLERMFERLRTFDGIRYDFILHYIAYHRSKIAEITQLIADIKAHLLACAWTAPYPRMRLLEESLSFYRQQSSQFQQILVRRQGRMPHFHQRHHSVGQRFYNAAPEAVAAVYRADAADRLDIQQNGQYRRGHPVLRWYDSPEDDDTPPDSP
jgi:hypothetical protein